MKQKKLLVKAFFPMLAVWALWKMSDSCLWISGVFNRASGWLHYKTFPLTARVDELAREYQERGE